MKNFTHINVLRAVAACVVIAAATPGCVSSSANDHRVARYRPSVDDRSPWRWQKENKTQTEPGTQTVKPPATEGRQQSDPAPDPTEVTPAARVLGPGDPVDIFLRGIPKPENIKDDVGQEGNITLPLIGTVKVADKTTSEVELMIETAYVNRGYYKKINVIVISRTDEYFIQGEIRRPARYALAGVRTLLQAIAEAGSYTEFANSRKIDIIRGNRVMNCNGKKIAERKEDDPVIEPGDIIKVHKSWGIR